MRPGAAAAGCLCGGHHHWMLGAALTQRCRVKAAQLVLHVVRHTVKHFSTFVMPEAFHRAKSAAIQGA